MQLQNYNYVCENCSNSFKAVNLFENHYAEFLMRTDTGKMSYLVAISDNVFNTLKQKFESMPKLKKVDINTRVALLHEIFGIMCDLADDGTEYKIGGKPICPVCGSKNMFSWEPVIPIEIVSVEVPRITHNRWMRLSESEKNSRIDEAIDRILFDKKKLGAL